MSKFTNFFKTKVARITGDFALNIIASIVYTFARQIVVLPLLAVRLSDADYGTLLTVLGIVNICNMIFGNTLNNVRLIRNSTYLEQAKTGDFLPLCTVGSVLSIFVILGMSVLFRLSFITTLLLCCYVGVNIFYQYSTSFFRLNLDFKRTLIVNCLLSVMYIACAFLFATGTLWPAVFLVGDIVGVLYVAHTAKFHKEGFQRTPLLNGTVRNWLILISGSLLGNLLTYADRILIYPSLGAAAVSYYSTASFFGKSASMVMVPISGVLLGYFSQRGFHASKKLFMLINGLSLSVLAFFLGGCWFFAPWFTQLLYPTLFAESEAYIMVANLATVLNIAGDMAQPMILKCCSTKIILMIQLIHAAAYLLATLLLMPVYGLLGFCWATILANSVRLAALYLIGFIKF